MKRYVLEDDLVEERSLRKEEVGEDHVGEELWDNASKDGQNVELTGTRGVVGIPQSQLKKRTGKKSQLSTSSGMLSSNDSGLTVIQNEISSPLSSHSTLHPIPDLLLVVPQDELLLLLSSTLQLSQLLVRDSTGEETQVARVSPKRELEIRVEDLLESFWSGGEVESSLGELWWEEEDALSEGGFEHVVSVEESRGVLMTASEEDLKLEDLEVK